MFLIKILSILLISFMLISCGNDTDDTVDMPEHSDQLVHESETETAQIRLYETEGAAAGEAIGDERLQQIGSLQKIIEGVAGKYSVRFEDPESLHDGTYRLEVQTLNALPIEETTDDVMDFLADHFDLNLQRTSATVNRYQIEIANQEELEEFRNHDSPPEINHTQRENSTVTLRNASLDHIARILQSEYEYEVTIDQEPGFRIDYELQLPEQWEELEEVLAELGLALSREGTEREIYVIVSN